MSKQYRFTSQTPEGTVIEFLCYATSLIHALDTFIHAQRLPETAIRKIEIFG